MDVVAEVLDLGAINTWLTDAHVDVTGPLTAHLLAGGRSNLTFRLEDAVGRELVLRRPPLGHVLPSAHDMAREHRVLSMLHAADFPVPTPRALCEDPDVTGTTFLVMDYVDGQVVATATEAGALGAPRATDVSASLVDTLVALHTIDPAIAGGRTAEGYLQRQVARWSEQWQLTQVKPVEDVDRLATWLSAHVPDITMSALVHGDYRLDNAILDPQTGRVRAVLDWEMSTVGDPIADLAVMLVYWTQSDDGRRAHVPVAEHITSAPGFWRREQIIQAYASATGHALEHLDFCVALACFKLAVIMESIHMRASKGQQRGVSAGDTKGLATATRMLAAMGVDVIEHGTVAGLSA
ncbi:MAG: phosphotransferase family protein [Candidatus Nanopelagicales bacterium]|jgi:aminoglycoside phosphotransferase (APT) family kinase protein|nr:phosphotransferase family protein [Candidatus Nanopelagicales bacterium]